MAVTGVFAADFSAFNKAVDESQTKLQGFEGASNKVESSLRLMTQSQEQVLDKIGAAGGRIDEVGAAAGGASGEVLTLSQSYQQFDGALAAVGVNLGPQVKGLEDLAAASGKTATQMGLLGTAGLAAGAFMTGWKIGEFIDGITGASTAVQKLTETWMGWSTAAETAGAKQDTINRAISMGAQEGIKYAEAIKFIETQTRINAATATDWAGKLNAAKVEVNGLSEAQRAEIAVAIEAGATTQQLSDKYGISALALDVLADKTRVQTAEQAKLNAEIKKEAEAREARNKANADGVALMERDARLMADRAAFDKQQEETLKQQTASQQGLLGAIANANKVKQDAIGFEQALIKEQAALDEENKKLAESFTKTGKAAADGNKAATDGLTKTTAATAGLTQQVEISADAIRGWIALMQYTNQANAILKENSLFTTSSQLERIGSISVPSFASGVENFGGGLAKVHGGEVLANLPPGTSVFPKGAGLGANISNVFNLVDSESNLARRVSEMIMRQIRSGTQLGTA